MVDSTNIWNKFGIDKLGRNKFYKNKKSIKISLMTDINGIPLSIFFMSGNRHDNTTFKNHIDDVINKFPIGNYNVMADKAYSCLKNYNYLDIHKFTHIIPPRKNMKICATYKYDKCVYKKRIKIEHIFSRLKMFRRITLRYDKYIKNFSGFVYLAFSIIGSRIIKKIEI